jgi:hypothetical protein
VTLTLMPRPTTSVIAGRPALVAGIAGVVGQPGVDLDGDPAVPPARRLVHRAQDVRGGADVGGRHHPDGLVDRHPAYRQVVELLLVALPGADRGLEDGRVGGHADDVPGRDELGEVPGGDALAGEIVEPDGDALLGETSQGVRGGGRRGRFGGHSDHLPSGARVNRGRRPGIPSRR